MNMRKQKYYTLARLAFNRAGTWHTTALCARSPLVELFSVAAGICKRAALAELVEGTAEMESAQPEFVVVKKSTGEVVDTFDIESDAVALIEKHRRQKKAVLELLVA